jgi:HK97 gp10 family phage protein
VGKNLQFSGFEEAATILDALPGRLGPQVLLKTLRKGGKPIVAEARSRVPVKKKALIRSIGTINGRRGGKGQQVYLGPRRGGGYKGYAGHLIEYGTAPRTKKNGASTGSVAAHPFMRPAFELRIGEAREIIKNELRDLIRDGFKSVKF